MDIAVLVFTYNRPEHTKKTLDALKHNTILPEKLYIFQDGRKETTDSDKWNQVNKIIHEVCWCQTELVVSDKNKGLADSIVNGINYAFQNNDAVIVLEDDIVTHPQFMEYMTKSLKKYKNCKEVFNINACSDRVVPCLNGTDAYFTGRASSWGWATWKDRWQFFDRDYRCIARLKLNEKLNERFHFWAADVESYLIGNVTGRCNSWASFWCLNIIEHGGYCLTPYKGFVNNIGFDGSGVHCEMADIQFNCRPFDERKSFVLPKKVEFPEDYKSVYDGYFSWVSREIKLECYNKILFQFLKIKNTAYIADYLVRRGISKVSVWGRGDICKLLLDAFFGRINVLAILESNPNLSNYQGIPVKGVTEIPNETQLIICIPVYDVGKIERKLKLYGDYKMICIDELLERVLE